MVLPNYYDLGTIASANQHKQFYLRYIELQSFSEVAREFGVSKQAVRKAVLNIQAQMREKYLG